MPFGGKGRLGKLCNEDEKAFDILCRRLQAVTIQRRSRITERERQRGREREKRKTIREEGLQERKRRRIRRGRGLT